MRPVLFGVVVLTLWAPAGAARPQERGYAPDLKTFQDHVRPFLKRHCLSCHGPEKQKGKLRLDTINGNILTGGDGNKWKEVYDKLQLGEMPPEKKPRPEIRDVERIVGWIVAEMRKAERAARSTGGKVVMRRLNRTEYANTVRDLLHVRFLFKDGPRDLLPPDGKADGFDKVGKALMIDPSLMSQYMDVARRIADKAVVTGPQPVETKTVRYEYEDTARSGAIGYQCHQRSIQCRKSDLVLMEGGARTWDHLHYDRRKYPTTIPIDGEYKIRVRMSADLGERGEPVHVRMTWAQRAVLGEWTLTAGNATPKVFELTLPVKVAGKGRDGPQMEILNGTKFYNYSQYAHKFNLKARAAGAKGDFKTVKKTMALAKAEGAHTTSQPNPKTYDLSKVPKVILDWIEIEGPIYGQWPPKSHREIFFEGPKAKKDAAYARRIFRRIMKRAFRRPVADAEVEPVVGVVEAERKAGESFEESVKVGLQFVLCSPKFLHLFEPNPEPGARKLNEYELASRLSYFLWSSMPDEALFRLAEEGRLRRPGAMEAQIRRMLADPKSSALMDGFAAQWMQAQKFAGITPNKQIYKNWDRKLETAAKREPLVFFEEILRKDLSVINFLDSDFAMLNERLARHYGVPGVKGKEFRRVNLPADSHRGGLLTQAGVLTIGSDGTRTLPVRRAVWVLETLFNRPPPPPPPNAGEVEPNIKGKHLTVRERLLQHQEIPSCASCHRKIDPYGLALENYDAVGAWRTRQNGENFNWMGDRAPAIDAGGQLPDGRTFKTPEEFRAILANEKDRFARAFTEKLLTYALGRSLEFTDAGTVDALATALGEGGYRMSLLIAAIARSETFQTK